MAFRFVYGRALDVCLLVADTGFGRWDLARSCLERRSKVPAPSPPPQPRLRLFDVSVPESLATLAAQGIEL